MFTQEQKEVAKRVVDVFNELGITAKKQAKYLQRGYECGDYEYFDTFNEYVMAFIDAKNGLF